MSVVPVEALSAITSVDALAGQTPAAPQRATGGSFSQMLLQGVDDVNQKLVDADNLATAFALDDSIPVHRVTYALEQARVSFEMMMQVRNRMMEAYQDIMRMQL